MNFHRKPITFVSHVRIKVRNLEQSLLYYQEVIGFQVIEQSETTATLSADGQNPLLFLSQPAQVTPREPRTTGLYHFALLLPKRSDLANIVQHFSEIGVRFGSSDHLVSEALYLSDPDGNGIEVYADRDPAKWQWYIDNVSMTVDPLNFSELLAEERQQSWQGLPADTTMGHIHLSVSDLESSEIFYIKGLGFDIVARYGSQALFISDGKYHHHIGLNTWNGVGAPAASPHSVGLESYTLVFANEEKRKKIVSQLKQIGATVTAEKDAFVTSDPSGNRIYLQI